MDMLIVPQVRKSSVYKKSVSICINSDHAKVLKRIRRDRKISAPAAAIRYKMASLLLGRLNDPSQHSNKLKLLLCLHFSYVSQMIITGWAINTFFWFYVKFSLFLHRIVFPLNKPLQHYYSELIFNWIIMLI